MERKKKLRFTQIFLFIFGLIVILITFLDSKKNLDQKILSPEDQKEITKKLSQTEGAGDVFYNIEYSGIDLAGNRFILKSEEAISEISSNDIINMKFVEANFYFKDETVLKIVSDNGTYNNRTLDMKFFNNIQADYNGSKLLAENAEYSNLESFLTISNNVRLTDEKGTMFADKLVFDIKSKSLNVTSLNDNIVKSKVRYK